MLPSWHPEEFMRRKQNLLMRNHVQAALRGVFAVEHFTEVATPILQTSPGNEVHLHAFATELRDVYGKATTRYLHTSPEFAMKKLLAAGMERIFQFAHVFRNNEGSSRHHPEFTMLEWYRAAPDLDAIKNDCITLVRAAASAAKCTAFQVNGMACNPFAAWESLSVAEAFRRYADIDLIPTLPPAVIPAQAGIQTNLPTERLAAEAKRIGVHVAEGDAWDDLFFRILGERIEPHLGNGAPTFLCDYPVAQAALARPKKDDPRFAERFELYICGIEIANAFGELTDAAEQRRRFEVDMDMKEKLYGERYPIDEDFLAALAHMPPSCGIALGFDRLIMLCAGVEKIDDVLWLPVV